MADVRVHAKIEARENQQQQKDAELARLVKRNRTNIDACPDQWLNVLSVIQYRGIVRSFTFVVLHFI